MSCYYIGLSTTGHDPAFCILDESGEVLFAEATERYLQDKRAWGAAADHLDHVNSAVSTYCNNVERIIIATSWSKAKVSDEEIARIKSLRSRESEHSLTPPLDEETDSWHRTLQRRAFYDAGTNLRYLFGNLVDADIRRFDHHLCHAAFACASSPFDKAQCLVLDGEGDVGSVSVFNYEQGSLGRKWRSWGAASLGAYYAWLTQQCGFDWRQGEEWKVMGLAAFGQINPKLVAPLSRLLNFENGKPIPAPSAVWQEVAEFIGAYGRKPQEDILTAANLAASGQFVYGLFADQVIAAMKLEPEDDLVITGGCALNSAFNGTIKNRHALNNVHIPSAPGDDGNAVGAALLAWQQDYPNEPLPKVTSAYLGSALNQKKLSRVLQYSGFPKIQTIQHDDIETIADLLANNKILGVMRGRAEFGPRGLGNRSIFANPAAPAMKDILNRHVKGREAYRPFAPTVRSDEVNEWFATAQASPYMSFTLPWRKDKCKKVPAVVHEDGTGRLQTVSKENNLWLYQLLGGVGRRTGANILLNTSFNIMGKPIVHDVEDALSVFASTGLDALLLENILIQK